MRRGVWTDRGLAVRTKPRIGRSDRGPRGVSPIVDHVLFTMTARIRGAAIIDRSPRVSCLRRGGSSSTGHRGRSPRALRRAGIGVVIGRRGDRVDQLVVDALMIALAVIVLY